MALTSSKVATTGTQIFLAAGDQAITTILFCNTDPNGTTALLDVYAVPYNGGTGTVGTGTQILKSLVLPATETFVMDAEKLILGNSDALYATSSVNNIVCATVSSVSI
jgi:hypothetical protein